MDQNHVSPLFPISPRVVHWALRDDGRPFWVVTDLTQPESLPNGIEKFPVNGDAAAEALAMNWLEGMPVEKIYSLSEIDTGISREDVLGSIPVVISRHANRVAQRCRRAAGNTIILSAEMFRLIMQSGSGALRVMRDESATEFTPKPLTYSSSSRFSIHGIHNSKAYYVVDSEAKNPQDVFVGYSSSSPAYADAAIVYHDGHLYRWNSGNGAVSDWFNYWNRIQIDFSGYEETE